MASTTESKAADVPQVANPDAQIAQLQPRVSELEAENTNLKSDLKHSKEQISQLLQRKPQTTKSLTAAPSPPVPPAIEPRRGKRVFNDGDPLHKLAGRKKQIKVKSRLHEPRINFEARKQARDEQQLKDTCTFKPRSFTKGGRPGGRQSGGAGVAACNRLYKNAKEINARRQQHMNRKKEKEVEGCTFSPSVSKKKGGDRSGVFNRLYSSAAKKRADTISSNPREDAECTFHPKTNVSSTNVTASSSSFDRLYQDAAEKQQRIQELRQVKAEKEKQELDECNFSPALSKGTATIVENLQMDRGAQAATERLFQDAEKRTIERQAAIDEAEQKRSDLATLTTKLHSDLSDGVQPHERLHNQGLLSKEDPE